MESKRIDEIELIDDLPNRKITKTILFLGDLSIVETHLNLIKLLNETQFTVLVGSQLKEEQKIIEDYYSLKNVNLVFLSYPITSWTQDRMLRSKHQISGVFSDHNSEGYSIYETVATSKASEILEFKSKKFTEEVYISQYTGKDSIVTNVKNEKYLKTNKSLLFYGDGGDRLVTKKMIFLGGKSFQYMKKIKLYNIETIEKLTNKKIIGIDEDESNRYSFHLDLYLTFLSEKNLILGSYKKALELLPQSLTWVDYVYMREKIVKEKAITNELISLGFNVISIPLIYKKDDGYISFNNGIFDEKTFYTSNYHFKDENINKEIKKMKTYVVKKFNDENLNLIFIDGGEKNMKLGGQVRCTAAVIENI